MKTIKSVSFLLVIGILCLGCKSKESALLKLKLVKGQELHYTIGIKYVCSNDIHMNTSMGLTVLVDSITHGSDYCMLSKINVIKTDINFGDLFGNGLSEKYDSDLDYNEMNSDQQALYAKYDSLMSNYYAITYNGKGEVIKPFTLNGKDINAPYGAELIQVPFPDKKLKVGDSWTATLHNPLSSTVAKVFKSNCTFTYTINNITADKVMLDVELQIQPEGLMSDFTKNVKGSGTYVINRANGCVENGYIKIPAKSCDDALISITTE